MRSRLRKETSAAPAFSDDKAAYVSKIVAVILGSVLLLATLARYLWAGSFAWQDVVLLATGGLLVTAPILVKVVIKNWGELNFRQQEVKAQSTPIPLDHKKEAQDFGENPDLAEAKKALLQDNPEKAIRVLEELAQREPRYAEELLTALTLSTNRRDWQKARGLLPTYGRPKHYVRLGYYSFQENDLATAADLTAKGLSLAELSDPPEDRKTVARLMNNLAYYYAVLGRSDSSERALHYAKEALNSRLEEGANAEALASSFDTLGLVQVVFASSIKDVEEGLKNLEEARRLGGRPDMYFRHIEMAKKRLADLTKDAGQNDTKS